MYTFLRALLSAGLILNNFGHAILYIKYAIITYILFHVEKQTYVKRKNTPYSIISILKQKLKFMSTVICTTECYFTSTGFRVENGDYYSIIEFDKLFTGHSLSEWDLLPQLLQNITSNWYWDLSILYKILFWGNSEHCFCRMCEHFNNNLM